LHYHDEYELNLIINASGAKRIVGNSIEVIGDLELVLIAPNLPHAWFTHECTSPKITEVTIQWHRDLLEDKFLKRNQLNFIRKMFELSAKGITFSENTKVAISKRILSLSKHTGFDSVIELLLILRELSTSREIQTISDSGFTNDLNLSYNSRRLDTVFQYLNNNYNKPITLKDVSKLVNMNEVSFSRFIKKRTGTSFIDSLNEIKLGHASRLLLDTTHSISEISYQCGFNNISNFNKIFKKKKGYTPSEFRQNFSGTRVFI
jgi:AraC-like DNA-binding protein